MDPVIETKPQLISSELLVSILFAPQRITTDLTDFGSTIPLMRHKTFSTWYPLILRLIVLYREKKFLDTIGQCLRPTTIESPITTTLALSFGSETIKLQKFPLFPCHRFTSTSSVIQKVRTIVKVHLARINELQ